MAITGMAVTGATTAGGNNIMNGEAIAGTHMDRRHRRGHNKHPMIIVAIIVRGLTNIIAKYQCPDCHTAFCGIDYKLNVVRSV
ncbi:hypothetical protein ACLK2D_00030 [Escherichia coli]